MNSLLVPVHRVDEIWPLIADRIVACQEEYGDCSAGEVWEMCRARGAFLIITDVGGEIKGASVWRFETWVKGPVLRNILLVGEDLKSWKASMRDCVERVAKEGGAKTYTFAGRKGWGREFPDAEITQVSFTMKV